MEPLQEMDDLINNYLFDVELYASSTKEDENKALQDTMQKIHDGLRKIDIADLQTLIRKYRKQHSELVDEREWREAREKPRNIPRELREKTVLELLRKIETLAREKERLQAQLAANPPKPAPTEQKSITASMKRVPTSQVPKEKTVKLPEKPPEKTVKLPEKPQKTAKLPEPKPVRNADHMMDAHDAWEEFSSATRVHRPAGQEQEKQEEPADTANPEGRIQNMVNQFLQKRPQVDWRERDRQDEENRKARFRKESEDKKKMEQWEETKKKTRTLPQRPHSRKSTPTKLPQQSKKKKWWMFGGDE